MLESKPLTDESVAELPRRTWLIDTSTLLTVVAAAALLLVAGDWFERLTMIGGIAVCVLVWRYSRDPLVVVAMDLLVLGAVGGWGLHLYERLWWYDDMAHFLFSMVATMALARLVLPLFRVKHLWLAFAALWLSWQGIGALWEILEWVSDQWILTRHSRGYADTLLDMIFNASGSALGVAVYWRWMRRPADEEVVMK